MANTVIKNNNFIEVALDGTTDFDITEVYNAPNGIRVRKITFVPSAAGDDVVVRDGEGGPRAFSAINVLGTYDILKDEFREDGKINSGKLMTPFIDANEVNVGIVNQAFIIFEL